MSPPDRCPGPWSIPSLKYRYLLVVGEFRRLFDFALRYVQALFGFGCVAAEIPFIRLLRIRYFLPCAMAEFLCFHEVRMARALTDGHPSGKQC
jgi:hypothetical protein